MIIYKCENCDHELRTFHEVAHEFYHVTLERNSVGEVYKETVCGLMLLVEGETT